MFKTSATALRVSATTALNNAWSTSPPKKRPTARPRSSTHQRTEGPNKPSTPSNSSPDTSAIFPTSPGACAKREPTTSCRRSRQEKRRPNSSSAAGRGESGRSTKIDPLCCPNCRHQMRVIEIPEAGPIVKKIPDHLDLWDVRNLDPPPGNDSHIHELVRDDSDSRIPQCDDSVRIPPPPIKNEIWNRPPPQHVAAEVKWPSEQGFKRFPALSAQTITEH